MKFTHTYFSQVDKLLLKVKSMSKGSKALKSTLEISTQLKKREKFWHDALSLKHMFFFLCALLAKAHSLICCWIDPQFYVVSSCLDFDVLWGENCIFRVYSIHTAYILTWFICTIGFFFTIFSFQNGPCRHRSLYPIKNSQPNVEIKKPHLSHIAYLSQQQQEIKKSKAIISLSHCQSSTILQGATLMLPLVPLMPLPAGRIHILRQATYYKSNVES